MFPSHRDVAIRLFTILALSLTFAAGAWGQTPGKRLAAVSGVKETTADIMARQAVAPPPPKRPKRRELEHPLLKQRPQNPEALAVSQVPAPEERKALESAVLKIHTTGSSFDAATLSDTGSFPPDSMGAVGPTQFVTFLNGRLRTHTKAGVADGVLNADPDVFFASAMTPTGGSVVFNFTSDPQVRYDRFTARWILTIIDVPCANASCTTTAANRLLMAVSDAASAGTISGSTVWTFFQFQPDPGTNFCDFPSLGVDVNAIYIGCNMFSSAGTFVSTNGYVVQKVSALGAGPLVVTSFPNLLVAGAGPFAPRGVDNFDPTATEGYFVGVDNATFSTIMFRRVSNPGSLTPTISGNISVTVPTTTFPNPVEHAGNTGGNNGRLDSLDDRLYAASIRNGRLWTAHNFRTSATGVANTAAQSRNSVRWYEFENLTTTPTLVQSGTVFDNAATRAAARQYFIPTVAVTGQGHAVVGFTAAGVIGATPAYVGRLAGDTLGTMVGPPTVAVTTFGTTTSNYNPPSDPGGAGGRRWGDYSFTTVDPLDEMTVWTIQQYNQASNSYAVRVGRLAAPPPATPTCSSSPISFTGPTGNVVIDATSSGGSGFYDPGADLPPPALPFNHISATVTNATVNNVTFNSPTQVTLNITAVTPGLQNVTITNPDGQSVTANGCIDVQAGEVADLAITKTDGVTTAVPGGSVTYTITASNAGPSNAPGATVADTFPASLTCTWTCVGAGGGTCTAAGSGNIGDTVNLPAGGSVTYTASCAVSAAATGTLSNTATVTAPAGVTDPAPGNNSATDSDTLTAVPGANVTATKTVSGSAVVGATLSYTITLTNGGAGAQADNPGAEFTDVLPPQLSLVSAVASSGFAAADTGTNTVTWNGAIPAGGTVTITIQASILPVAAGQTVSNQGTVSFDSDGNGTNDATAQTDDPGVAGDANPTSVQVAAAPADAIPTLSQLGFVVLALALTGMALALLRRRGRA